MSSFRVSLAELSAAQKPKRGVSWYSRAVNRPLGRCLAAAANELGMTPNGVTAVSAIVTASGIVLLAIGPQSAITGMLVALLLVFGFALDAADGQLSRLQGASSRQGEWLDHVVDAAKTVSLHLAVLVAWWRADMPVVLLAAPLAFTIVASVGFSALTLVGVLQRGHERPVTTADASGGLRAVALLPADAGVIALSFLAWGMPAVFVPIYLFLLLANSGIYAALLGKWYKELAN